MDCFDNILHTPWYWQDLAQEIAKCYIIGRGFAEVLILEKWNAQFSWKMCNILMHIHIDLDNY